MRVPMRRRVETSIRHILALFCCVFIAGALLPVDLAAQESGSEAAAADESNDADEASSDDAGDGDGRGATTFEPAEEEQVSGLGLMVAAYMAIWVLLIGYFVVLYNRQKRIGKDLDELKLRVEALDDLD